MTKPNLSSPQHCLCFNLRRATRLATRAYDEALAPVGLTAPQFSALALLEGAGPMTATGFAEAMETERTTLTRNLTLLEGNGLISRKPGKDKRVRVIGLTPKGRRKLQAALPHWRAVQTNLINALGAPAARRVLTSAADIEAAFKSTP